MSNNSNNNTNISQLGTLQLQILSILWNQEMYGLEIIKHLKLRQYIIGTNQLYPALKRLEKLTALTSRKQQHTNDTRIYYKITSYGRQLITNQLMMFLGVLQDILLEKLDFIGEYCAQLLQLKVNMSILDLSKEFYELFIQY